MADFPVKSDFPDKPASLKKAIKEALAPYNRQFISELVADAVDKAIDISLQQNNDLPKRFQFLKWEESHRPAVPQSLLNLPVPEKEESFRPVICDNCKHNFLRRVHYWLHVQELNQFSCVYDSPIFEENIMLQRHIANQESSIADQQLSSLQVLFGFIEENYYDFQSLDI